MPKIKFTEAKIKSLKSSTSYVEYYDTRAKHGHGSLGLRVSPAGKKAWFVLFRNSEGKQKRFPLKMDYPKLSLAAANKKLMDLDIISGGDPIEEAREKAQQELDDAAAKVKAAGEHAARPTLKDLWEIYVENRGVKASSTIIEEDRKWLKDIKPENFDDKPEKKGGKTELGNMAVADITSSMMFELLSKKNKTSPVAANRLYSLLTLIFKPALAKKWITVHPLQWVDKPSKEKPRKRKLSDDEIKTLWGLLENEHPNVRDTMKMMLLTGQRKGEIFSIHWKDIDSETMVWKQETNKTDSEMLVPLSPQVMDIINSRQIIDRSGWLFPSTRNDSHVIDIKKARLRLNEDMETTDTTPWTEHDLRRTARTLLSKVKIEHHIRERVLNHSMGKMEGTYDVYDYLDEKRDALCKLADEIDKIVGNKPKPQGK